MNWSAFLLIIGLPLTYAAVVLAIGMAFIEGNTQLSWVFAGVACVGLIILATAGGLA